MGCAEGQSPFAGSLRVSLSYKFFPLPGQEGGKGDGRKVFQHPAIILIHRPEGAPSLQAEANASRTRGKTYAARPQPYTKCTTSSGFADLLGRPSAV
jgi:hypothetical protein